jgi:hypothetical protein
VDPDLHSDPDPHHFRNLDPDPHQKNLDPYQIKGRIWIRIQIRIKVISLIPNRIRINLHMTSQNVPMEYEPFCALFPRFERLFRG